MRRFQAIPPLAEMVEFSVKKTSRGEVQQQKVMERTLPTRGGQPSISPRKRQRIEHQDMSADTSAPNISEDAFVYVNPPQGQGHVRVQFMVLCLLHLIPLQTSHDYIREWFSRREQQLQEILDLEGLQDFAQCNSCNASPPTYRCRDCNGGLLYCTECCKSQHHLHPFHRVDHWTGTFFEPSWLWKVGICLDLGHRGAQCPGYQHPRSQFGEYENDFGNAGEDEEEEPEGVGWANPGRPSPAEANGLKVVTIVHINGIHHLPIRPCVCLNSPAEDIQMLRMRLYPSTYKNIRTLFTFALLDDYLLENLECQTSGLHYFQKLRRMTNKAFPHLVPVSLFFPIPRLRCLNNYRIAIGNCCVWVVNGAILRSENGLALGTSHVIQEPRKWRCFVPPVHNPV
jgi:CxC2 like cysteine cluster associated with KDZ transposases